MSIMTSANISFEGQKYEHVMDVFWYNGNMV